MNTPATPTTINPADQVASRWANARTGVFVLLFAALVFGVSIFEVRSPDLYWHIKMGSDWIFKGLSPFVDHYSYTMPGKPIVYVAWGFQVIISLLYTAFGFAGVGLYRVVAFSLTLFLLERTMARWGVAGGVRLFALATCLVGFILHSEPRPELASLPFEALFVGLFLKWRDKRSPRQLVLPGEPGRAPGGSEESLDRLVPIRRRDTPPASLPVLRGARWRRRWGG